jgi:hypothetical protein
LVNGTAQYCEAVHESSPIGISSAPRRDFLWISSIVRHLAERQGGLPGAKRPPSGRPEGRTRGTQPGMASRWREPLTSACEVATLERF